MARKILTTDIVPLRYLQVQKCGCTFIKNILWSIQFGKLHPNPRRIHDDESLIPSIEINPEVVKTINDEDMAIISIRNPADRFFSIYFDKIIGDGRKRFVPLSKHLQQNFGLNIEASSAETHRRNCMILINWFDNNIAKEIDFPNDPHWMPFSRKSRLAKRLNLKVLLTEELSFQMKLILGPDLSGSLPDFQSIEKNSTNSKDLSIKVIDLDLKQAIYSVYKNDIKAYKKARDIWRRNSIPNAKQVW